MVFLELYARNLGDDIGQLVDSDHPVLAKIERFVVIRMHQAVPALNAIIDIAERAGLLAVAPNLDLAGSLSIWP